MKKIVVMGSIGAGVLLILAMLTTVVSAQTIKSIVDEKTNFIQNILNKKDKVTLALLKDWYPGYFIGEILLTIVLILVIIDAWLKGYLFY